MTPEQFEKITKAMEGLAKKSFIPKPRRKDMVVRIEDGESVAPLKWHARLWLSQEDFDSGEDAALEIKGS